MTTYRHSTLRAVTGGVLLAGLTAGCGGPRTEQDAPQRAVGQAIIYGSDNRVEARDYWEPELVRDVTDRVGALVRREFVTRDADGWLLSGPALRDQVPLCEGERFAEEPRLALCTAFLTASNTIATAGHCLPPDEIANLVFVRGYMLGDGFPRLAPDRVNELDSVLSRVNDGLATASARDVAIARLRSDEALPALALTADDGALARGDSVIVAGATEGLPIKIDDSGQVFDNGSSEYFEMTSDTFQGSSGSPVFAPDGRVLGMVVGGAADYEWDSEPGCFRRSTLPSPVARGEIAMRVNVVRELLGRALGGVGKSASAPACSLWSGPRRSGEGFWLWVVALVVASLGARRTLSASPIRNGSKSL